MHEGNWTPPKSMIIDITTSKILINIIQVSIKSTTSRKKKQTAGDCDKAVDSQTSTSTHQNITYIII